MSGVATGEDLIHGPVAVRPADVDLSRAQIRLRVRDVAERRPPAAARARPRLRERRRIIGLLARARARAGTRYRDRDGHRYGDGNGYRNGPRRRRHGRGRGDGHGRRSRHGRRRRDRDGRGDGRWRGRRSRRRHGRRRSGHRDRYRRRRRRGRHRVRASQLERVRDADAAAASSLLGLNRRARPHGEQRRPERDRQHLLCGQRDAEDDDAHRPGRVDEVHRVRMHEEVWIGAVVEQLWVRAHPAAEPRRVVARAEVVEAGLVVALLAGCSVGASAFRSAAHRLVRGAAVGEVLLVRDDRCRLFELKRRRTPRGFRTGTSRRASARGRSRSCASRAAATGLSAAVSSSVCALERDRRPVRAVLAEDLESSRGRASPCAGCPARRSATLRRSPSACGSRRRRTCRTSSGAAELDNLARRRAQPVALAPCQLGEVWHLRRVAVRVVVVAGGVRACGRVAGETRRREPVPTSSSFDERRLARTRSDAATRWGRPGGASRGCSRPRRTRTSRCRSPSRCRRTG